MSKKHVCPPTSLQREREREEFNLLTRQQNTLNKIIALAREQNRNETANSEVADAVQTERNESVTVSMVHTVYPSLVSFPDPTLCEVWEHRERDRERERHREKETQRERERDREREKI